METTNNNFNDFNELDDLRQQLNDLKNKVDQQGRLNESLVKKAVQGKMKGLHRFLLRYCVIMGLFVPFIMYDFIRNQYSWPFIIFTLLMFLGSFTAEYLINRMDVNRMGDDLVETARKLLQMKKNRRTQLSIGFCTIAIWLPWYGYEIYKTMADSIAPSQISGFMTGLAIAMVFGVSIGLAIGLSLYRRMQRTNDEMINQINDLTREND